MYVIKRDGSRVLFDISKVVNAINKAMVSVDGTVSVPSMAENIASIVWSKLDNKDFNVENIQDIIEKELMKSNRPDVAKEYILFREERSKARRKKDKLVEAITRRNEATLVENSNANVDENSFSGREKEASADIQKIIALDYVLSPEVAAAHKEMLVYQHDLEKTCVGVHNCLFVDFKKLFEEGFSTRNGDIRPPSTFSTACQLVAVIFQCQSQVQFGGVGAVHLDYDLAPFVKKSFVKHFKTGLKYVENFSEEVDLRDVHINSSYLIKKHPKAYDYAIDMTEKEGRQSAEALYHNLNTLESRAGSQVPFTSINVGRDTSIEGQLVSKWIFQASLAGIGKFHLTPIFPISIFQYKQGCNVNPEDPNYHLKQLALESMSKRIYPNFVNCDCENAHEDANDPDTFFATMGCRTMIGYDRFDKNYNRVGRGNLVPNTIILPKIGIEHGICLGAKVADFKGFWKKLEETLELCEKGLLERFDIMVSQSPSAAPFMYKNGTMRDSQKCEGSVYEALKHSTLGIGYLGIAEMCVAMFGESHAVNKEAYAFALKVVERISDYAKEASERNDLNITCYATPAEGLCHSSVVALRKQYGVIKDITDKEFITNSHHVPVWQEIGIFEKLNIEAPFCKYPTAGCITYVELDTTFIKNVKAIEQIVDYAFKELGIPYLAFNFPIDTCLTCGFQGELNDKCSECESQNIQQLRRVTGYLTTDCRNFNIGKQDEVSKRIKHSFHT